MEPEEIDKLFKNKFDGFSPAPSSDAWKRLNQKMEPPKKEKPVWLMYVAASVSILLVVGVLFFRNQNTNQGPSIAQVKTELPPSQPKAEEKIKIIENNSESQATEPIQVASTKETKDNKITEPKAADTKLFEKEAKESPVLAAKQQAFQATDIQVAAENKKTPELKTDEKTNELKVTEQPAPSLVAAVKPIPAATNVIEVTITREESQTPTYTSVQEAEIRESLTRKGNLLKNIYKQAVNLKNGEPVELATLGVNTQKINTESKVIKEKLNKVISL